MFLGVPELQTGTKRLIRHEHEAQSPLFAMPSDAQLKPGVILNGAPRASRVGVYLATDFPAELRKADSRIQSYSLEF